MKTTNSFYWTFIDTLLYNVATIAAIVIGVCQFLIRAWNANNGTQKTRKVIQTLLAFIDTLIEHSKVYLAEPPAVPVAPLPTKTPPRPKR